MKSLNLHKRIFSIYFDGNISSGKSTICESFSGLKQSKKGKDLEVKIFTEIGHGDGVLDCYLKNPQELSAMFQSHMLSLCVAREFKAICEQESSDENSKVIIVDRSITGNAIFALANHIFKKNISEKEFEFYKVTFGQAMKAVEGKAFSHGDVSIYLHAPVDVLIGRCVARDHASEISAYDAEYFKNIEQMSMVAILSNLSREHPHPQLVLNWNDEMGTMPNFKRIMDSYLENRSLWDSYVPTQVVLFRETCEDSTDEVCNKRRLDLSHCESELEFFSYSNVLLMMKKLFTIPTGPHSKKKVRLFIKVPLCLTSMPFNGPFVLQIN